MFMFVLSTTTYHFPAETAMSISQPTNDVSPSFQVTRRTGCFGQVGDWVALILSDLLKFEMPIKCVCANAVFLMDVLDMCVFKVQGVQVVFSLPHWHVLHCKLCMFVVFDVWNIDGLHSLIRRGMSYIGWRNFNIPNTFPCIFNRLASFPCFFL